MSDQQAEVTVSAAQDERDARNFGYPDRIVQMVMYCPRCFSQHVDAPAEQCEHVFQLSCHDRCELTKGHEGHHLCAGEPVPSNLARWTNPPHRKHFCHTCGHTWTPFPFYTNGVQNMVDVERQTLTVDTDPSSVPTGGTFTILIGTERSEPLPHDASPTLINETITEMVARAAFRRSEYACPRCGAHNTSPHVAALRVCHSCGKRFSTEQGHE